MKTENLQVNNRQIVMIWSFLFWIGFAALFVDVPLAHWLSTDPLPRELKAFFQRVEVLGHAYGIGLIGLTVWFVSIRNRIWLPRFFVAAYSAGLLADATKLLVWRQRPCVFDFSDSVWGTFDGSVFTTHLTSFSKAIESSHHSFPSAHTATITAAVLMLARMYPHARWWFWTLGILVSLSRIESLAHFASDVSWGACLGVACYRLALSTGRLQFGVAKLEKLISRRSADNALVTIRGSV